MAGVLDKGQPEHRFHFRILPHNRRSLHHAGDCLIPDFRRDRISDTDHIHLVVFGNCFHGFAHGRHIIPDPCRHIKGIVHRAVVRHQRLQIRLCFRPVFRQRQPVIFGQIRHNAGFPAGYVHKDATFSFRHLSQPGQRRGHAAKLFQILRLQDPVSPKNCAQYFVRA